LYLGGRGFARTKKKNVRATALGPSKIIAVFGILRRLTPIIHRVCKGALNKGNRTLGKICVPVLISQPAFITDQVHITAATIVVVRRTHFLGHWKQIIDNITSTTRRKEISMRIQPRYSSSKL
jgi:hypothetical protein